MVDDGQNEGDQLAGRAVSGTEETVARAIISEIFAGVPEPHRPTSTADMPEEQAARFQSAARAAIVASLSAGEPDGMETTAEERTAWANSTLEMWIGAAPLIHMENQGRLLRDFGRLLAREAARHDTDEIIGDAIAKANPAKWEDVPSHATPSGARRLTAFPSNEGDDAQPKGGMAMGSWPTVSPDREALSRHIDRLRDDLTRFSATRELTGFEITASSIADACDDLIRAPAPDREALAESLTHYANGAERMAKRLPSHDASEREWFTGLRDDLQAAIAYLRLPAQAEMEEMARRLDDCRSLVHAGADAAVRDAALASNPSTEEGG